MIKKVTFLGLGVMGFPMAGWLKRAGLEVTVFNRTAEKADRWVSEYGGRKAETAADAASDAEAVFSCLGDDPDLREVILGQGVIEAMSPGTLFIDHTTASADMARELEKAGSARGIQCLDAPVSGGQAGAEGGQLTVMVGGESFAFEQAEPLINSYAKTVRLVGPSGCGQLTKMANQIAIAGLVVICGGAAQSWQMDNRWKTMVNEEFDFGFAVEWMRKDLRICLNEARRNGAELPVAALVDQFYADIIRMGGKRWDTSSLIARLNRHENP